MADTAPRRQRIPPASSLPTSTRAAKSELQLQAHSRWSYRVTPSPRQRHGRSYPPASPTSHLNLLCTLPLCCMIRPTCEQPPTRPKRADRTQRTPPTRQPAVCPVSDRKGCGVLGVGLGLGYRQIMLCSDFSTRAVLALHGVEQYTHLTTIVATNRWTGLPVQSKETTF